MESRFVMMCEALALSAVIFFGTQWASAGWADHDVAPEGDFKDDGDPCARSAGGTPLPAVDAGLPASPGDGPRCFAEGRS